MEYAKLESACLAHVDDTYYYGAYCRSCGHHARLSLTKLRARLGGDYPLRKVREKLRCERCGGRRQIVITFLAPNQRSGKTTIAVGGMIAKRLWYTLRQVSTMINSAGGLHGSGNRPY